MAAQRPPSADPLPETLDEADLDIDQTAPPQRSPLRGVLPFGAAAPGRPPGPPPNAPAPSPAGPVSPWAAHAAPQAAAASPPPAPKAQVNRPSFGEETAPAERSPLAAALPFRHAKAAAATAATVGFPMPTPEDLRRLAGGGPDPSAAHARPPTGEAPAHARPAGAPAIPAGGGPVAAHSTGHFGLSIEQYAALCAEVATSPERGEAIFAQYGLAARQDRITADLAWQERLRADNALMARWQALYLHYHEHYRLAKR